MGFTVATMTVTDAETTTPAIDALSGVVIDCADPPALAAFYSSITGWAVRESDPTWASVVTPNNLALCFQGVEDYVAPQWPTTSPPQQFHLDFDVADLDTGEERVTALGARKAEHQPGTTFRVFLDPEGHPFCLCLA